MCAFSPLGGMATVRVAPAHYRCPHTDLPLSLTATVVVGGLLWDVSEPEAWVECQASEWENETQIQPCVTTSRGGEDSLSTRKSGLPPAAPTDVAVALAHGTLTGILR